MDLSEDLVVYGFGSYFLGCREYHDVDILIVHQSGSQESCQFAIQCKKYFILNMIKADVTILSQHEEHQISFITKSRARRIGKIDQGHTEGDLCKILEKCVNGIFGEEKRGKTGSENNCFLYRVKKGSVLF